MSERPGAILIAEIAERATEPASYTGAELLACNDVQALLTELDALRAALRDSHAYSTFELEQLGVAALNFVSAAEPGEGPAAKRPTICPCGVYTHSDYCSAAPKDGQP